MRLRRSIAFALLSLLLVLSQQMCISHGLSHWPDSSNVEQQARQWPQQDQRQVPKSLAPDQSCAQCLAFAQIGSALDTPFHSFPAVHDTTPAIVVPSAQPNCLRTVCVFQSRAPPVPA